MHDEWLQMSDYGVEATNHLPTFGLHAGVAWPVMKPITDTILLHNNSGRSFEYCLFLPVGQYMFKLSATPGKGILKPHSSKSIVLELSLLCTTRVSRKIKLSIYSPDSGGGDEEHDHNKSLASAHFELRGEGQISDRLDPADITLDPTPIGQGSYGTVYPGAYKSRVCAVKVMRLQRELSSSVTREFIKECDLYQRLRHPMIVEFIGASYVPGKLCMLTELMEYGSLETLLDGADHIPFLLQLRFAKNIAEAVGFLHHSSVLYRDLKVGLF